MMVNFSNKMSEAGHDVTLLLIRKEGEFLRLVNRSVFVEALDKTGYLSLFPQLKNRLKIGQFDMFFTATPSLNVLAILAAKAANVQTRIIISERSNTFKEFYGKPWGGHKAFFFLIPFVYRYANAIVAVSKGVADDLRRFAFIGKNKVKVIYNPAFNAGSIIEQDLVVGEPWLDKKKVPVIISAGRLTRQKNFPLLIKAFTLLHKTTPANLIILGDGPLEAELKALVGQLGMEDYVRFAGFQINPIHWISKADVFVLSSSWEGFGNILVDALAAGTTIVSTDCKSGPAEILDNGKYGYILKGFSEDEMSKTIMYALENKFDRNHLHKRAHFFEREYIMNQYEELMLAL